MIDSRIERAPSTEVSSSGDDTASSRGRDRALLAGRHADPEQRLAGVAHDRAHVREVEVDQAGQRDQVGDALHALAQHVVGDAERVHHRGALLEHRQQAVVGDHDQRVDVLGELGDALVGLRARGACPRSRTAS